MSRPLSVVRREAIERAQQQAREILERHREAAAAAVEQVLEAAATELAAMIQQHAAPDGSLPPTALFLLEQLIAQRLRDAEAQWRTLLAASLARSIEIGGAVAASGEALRGVVARTSDFLNAFRAADGLALSDRLWRVSQQLQDDTVTMLRGMIARGTDAARQVEQLLAAGRPVPGALAQQAREAQADTVARRLVGALTGEGGSAQWALTRLLRTEINRAYTESFVESLRGVDDVAGVKFTLSPLHPRFDVCDLHAKANLHGMGPGVYPLGQHPYPAHPMTLSFLQPVFVDEISADDRAGKETPFDWLRRLPGDQQDAVLGGQRKGEAFRAGLLLPGELRWPWYAIAQRLGTP